ncbi:MAG: tRNA (adenosine(37)-N6)-threonylcarbamoyltransferase complex dimerization subunit type 1 TsaB [Pseudomonadota bacterium]
MRTLAIETATEACSIALFEGDNLIAHDHQEIGRGHAERLIPMVANLPRKGRSDRIFVSLGPGSFTGVRIGIASARALGFAWQTKVIGYPTLALVAAMALERERSEVTVCMNGGHGEWFVQDFAADGSSASRLASLTPEQAVRRSHGHYIAGNRAHALAEISAAPREVFETLPDARQCLSILEAHFTSDLAPIYGRHPDAKPLVQPAS